MEGSPSPLSSQRCKARTSPPSSQKYDTIPKRENMFLCGQAADQLFAHAFCCDFLILFSFFFLFFCQHSQNLSLLFFFFPSFFFFSFFFNKIEEEGEATQAVS